MCPKIEQAEAPNTCTWENILDLKTQFEGTVQNFKDDFLAWREHSFNVIDTFKFWDTFIHVDFMSYLGLYLAIRSRDWDLRNASLKKLCCLFYAFDRHNWVFRSKMFSHVHVLGASACSVFLKTILITSSSSF
jgi:hypothetical protein